MYAANIHRDKCILRYGFLPIKLGMLRLAWIARILDGNGHFGLMLL